MILVVGLALFQQQGQGGAGQQQASRHKRPSADAAGFRQYNDGCIGVGEGEGEVRVCGTLQLHSVVPIRHSQVKPIQLCAALFNPVVITGHLILHGDTGGQCPGAIFVVRPAAQICGGVRLDGFDGFGIGKAAVSGPLNRKGQLSG